MTDDGYGESTYEERPYDEQPYGGTGFSTANFGEEARKLAESIAQWARRTLPAPPSAHSGPQCQWCPLCQVANVLRGERPELTDRLMEAGSAIAGTLRTLIETAAAHASGPSTAQPAADQPPTSAATDDADAHPPRVEHIRLTDPTE